MDFKPLTFLRTSTVERTVVGLLTLAFVLLLLVAGASVIATRKAHELNAEAARNELVRRTAHQILIDSLNAETGQRGYLLTGQRDYLGVYRQAVSRLTAEMVDLRIKTSGAPAEARMVDRLKIQIDAKVAELGKSIAFMDAGRRAEALALVKTGQGRAYMGETRRLIQAIDTSEGELLGLHTRQGEAAGREALAVNLASALMVAIVGVVSLAVVRRYIGDLRASRSQLDAMNQGLERTVAERTDELVRANEEIQRFAYIVSHDLRAPLVNVMGYTAELERAGATLEAQVARVEAEAPDVLDPEAARAIHEDVPEAIGFIRSSTEKMDGLIKAILKLSRDGRRVLTPEPLAMTSQIQAVADSFKHQTHELGAEIVVEPLPELVSDRLSLDQVFANLLDNALKYLAPGRAGHIVVRGREEGAMAVFEVEDNGRGILPRDHQRIFELFRRAGVQDTPGEGLGLAFVKATVRRLGGSIDVRSELGQGSTFILKFPKRLVLDASEYARIDTGGAA